MIDVNVHGHDVKNVRYFVILRRKKKFIRMIWLDLIYTLVLLIIWCYEFLYLL